jgi:hydroxymethylbilane synthase
MLPAVAQGAIGIEVRDDNAAVKKLLAAIHCPVTELRVTAERAFLAVMDGSCKTPLAGLMSVPDPQNRVRFDVLAARPDGTDVKRASYVAQVANLHEAQKLGKQAGEELKAQLPPGYISLN